MCRSNVPETLEVPGTCVTGAYVDGGKSHIGGFPSGKALPVERTRLSQIVS